MLFKISRWLNKPYPQNIIIKRPLIGVLLFLLFSVCFAIIYKPLEVHESRLFNFEITMAVYFIISAIPLFGIIQLLKSVRYFSNQVEWTIGKEILSIIISLLWVGITVYFSAFVLEPPVERWNLRTFFNSLITASLIGIIPFLFFTLLNYRSLFFTEIIKNYNIDLNSFHFEKPEELIRIQSQLKKEELAFFPHDFLYAESDANYIVFHLNVNGSIKKKTIRNSMGNIEDQLCAIPYYFRTHRAFIVNLKKVISRKGIRLAIV